MEYTRFMGLSDEDFINEIFKLFKEKDRKNFDILRERPFIMDRFKNLISNNKINGYRLDSALKFIENYNSYISLSNILNVVSNYSKYSDEQRIRVFNYCALYDENKDVLKYFSDNEKMILSSIIDGYMISKRVVKMSDNAQKYVDKYSEIVSVLNRILFAYSKYGEGNKLYLTMYDNIKLKPASFSVLVKYTRVAFYQSLCSGSNILNVDILNKFNINDICLLEKIDRNYSSVFDKYDLSLSDDVCTSIDDYEKLFKLLDRINSFLNKRKSLEYCAGYVCNDLKISLKEIETFYKSVFKDYYAIKFKQCECDSSLKSFIDSRELRFLDICNFFDMFSMYKELTRHTSYLVKLLCGDRKDIEKLVNMIYGIRYSNGIVPSINQTNIDNKIKYFDKTDKVKCSRFVLGYREFYSNQKTLTAARKQKISDKKVKDLDLYVSCVQLFLDSGCESIDEYFGKNCEDKKSFIKALMILEKNEHSIYQEYLDYVLNVENKRHSIMIEKLKEIVNLINTGVVEDGHVRKFDLIDFYLCTKLSRKNFLNIIKENRDDIGMSDDEYANVTRFFAQYKGDKIISEAGINLLYNTSVSYPNEWDDDGNVVSRYVVTKEDKQDTIIKLNDMGIPLTTSTYGIMLKRNVDEIINNKNVVKCLTK